MPWNGSVIAPGDQAANRGKGDVLCGVGLRVSPPQRKRLMGDGLKEFDGGGWRRWTEGKGFVPLGLCSVVQGAEGRKCLTGVQGDSVR